MGSRDSESGLGRGLEILQVLPRKYLKASQDCKPNLSDPPKCTLPFARLPRTTAGRLWGIRQANEENTEKILAQETWLRKGWGFFLGIYFLFFFGCFFGFLNPKP